MAKSLYRSCGGSHFYGTEYEIWADFWPVVNTEKKWGADYEQIMMLIFYIFVGKKNVKFSLNTLQCSIITKKLHKGAFTYSMVPIKRTVFLPTVTVLKNTVRLIGTIEYDVRFLGT